MCCFHWEYVQMIADCISVEKESIMEIKNHMEIMASQNILFLHLLYPMCSKVNLNWMQIYVPQLMCA